MNKKRLVLILLLLMTSSKDDKPDKIDRIIIKLINRFINDNDKLDC
mgnify:CR=1 FL=1